MNTISTLPENCIELNKTDLQETNGGILLCLLGAWVGFLLEHNEDVLQGAKDAVNDIKDLLS